MEADTRGSLGIECPKADELHLDMICCGLMQSAVGFRRMEDQAGLAHAQPLIRCIDSIPGKPRALA